MKIPVQNLKLEREILFLRQAISASSNYFKIRNQKNNFLNLEVSLKEKEN